jgi:hypothetical protein
MQHILAYYEEDFELCMPDGRKSKPFPSEPASEIKQPEVVLTGAWGYIARKFGIPVWGQLLIFVLAIAFCFIVQRLSSLGSRVSNQSEKSISQMSKIDKRLALIEQKLGLQIGSDLLTRIKTYARQADYAKASDIANTAMKLISDATTNRIPSQPEFFLNTITTIDDIESSHLPADLAKKIFQMRVTLASYRSALEPPPDIPTELITLPPDVRIITRDMLGGRAVYRINHGLQLYKNTHLVSWGAAINGSEIPPTQEMLNPPSIFISQDQQTSVDGLILIGSSQTLDGILWKNVVFFREHIKYQGGDLSLDHVRFVDCTFEIEDNEYGIRLTEYAALAQDHLAKTS